MCSPLSGVDPQEAFDVLPYAARVGEYLLSIVNKYTLPRKLKVAFTNSSRNEAHATFRDLGFVANPIIPLMYIVQEDLVTIRAWVYVWVSMSHRKQFYIMYPRWY